MPDSKTRSKRALIGLIIWCLVACLTLSACSTCPTRIERPVGPSAALTEPTPEPAPPARPVPNGKLAEYILRLQEALRSANSDKAAIRFWSNSLKDSHGSP